MARRRNGPALTGPDEPAPPAEPVRRWLAGTAGLAVALLVVLAAVVLLAVRAYTDADIQSRRPAVLAATEHYAVSVSSLSSGTEKSGLDALKELGTPRYQATLAGQVGALEQVLKFGNVRSDGKVTLMGVEHLDDRSAVVLAAVESRVSDLKVPGGELRRYRLAVTLQRDGDRWLVDHVDMTGAAPS